MAEATCNTPQLQCAHCGLPFRGFWHLQEHAKRSGHQVLPRCGCGTPLVGAVSLAARTCGPCRWIQREGLGPYGLRLLARGYGEKASRLSFIGNKVSAADHTAEANALLAAAAEREVSCG